MGASVLFLFSFPLDVEERRKGEFYARRVGRVRMWPDCLGWECGPRGFCICLARLKAVLGCRITGGRPGVIGRSRGVSTRPFSTACARISAFPSRVAAVGFAFGERRSARGVASGHTWHWFCFCTRFPSLQRKRRDSARESRRDRLPSGSG